MSEARMKKAPAGPTASRPSVTVLMATFNGAKFLPEQLQSIYQQTVRPSRLIISDDLSTDSTVETIKRETSGWDGCETQVLQGPGKGPWQNFGNLLRNIPADAETISLSDQDDSWLPNKLDEGLRALSKSSQDEPALFGSATWICNADLKRLRLSRTMTRKPCFSHALAQNFAGGNTMLLNNAGIELVRQTQALVNPEVVPDWWLYLLISGAGGRIIFSETPTVLYRQHGRNVIGSNLGFSAALCRGRKMMDGQYARWNDANIESLDRISGFLTPENSALINQLKAARSAATPQRLRQFYSLNIRREGLVGQLGLWGSVLLGKF